MYGPAAFRKRVVRRLRRRPIQNFPFALLRFRPRHQIVDPAVKLSESQKLVQEKIREQLRLKTPAAPVVIP
jgi:hypothetical protein